MKKVVIENSVNVNVMIEKMEDEFGYWNENYDFDFVKNYVLENGNGIYEFSFGEMGLGEIRKNDEYFSLEEMVENDLVRKNNKFSREECVGYYNDYYNDDNDCRLELRGEDFVYMVSYNEDDSVIFVNVTV